MKARTDAERRRRQAGKTARIMTISAILDSRETISIEEAKRIAEKLGVCQRTVYRDILVIRESRELLATYGAELMYH